MGSGQGAWLDPSFPWKWSGAGPHFLPHTPSHDDSHRELLLPLAEVSLVSPPRNGFHVSSWENPVDKYLARVHLMCHPTFLNPF